MSESSWHNKEKELNMWEVSSMLALFLYPSWVEFHLLGVLVGSWVCPRASSSPTPSSLPQARLSSGKGAVRWDRLGVQCPTSPAPGEANPRISKAWDTMSIQASCRRTQPKSLKGKVEGGRASFLPHGHLILQPWIRGTRGLQACLGAQGQGSLGCPWYQLDPSVSSLATCSILAGGDVTSQTAASPGLSTPLSGQGGGRFQAVNTPILGWYLSPLLSPCLAALVHPSSPKGRRLKPPAAPSPA